MYWSKFPAPWFVDRCNAVAARGTVELEVWFDVRHPDKWDWDVDESEWAFRARYVPARRLAGWANRLPLPELRARPPDLFVSDYDNAHIVLGFAAARASAGRTAFRVLPTFDAWSERTWWRELGKHVVFRAVDGAKVGGLDGAQLAGRYGLPAERTWDVTQSVDLARYSAGANTRPGERETARRELGLSGVVLIYVGRLWDGKGVDLLLDAYTELRRGGKDVSLLLVGNGPDEQRYRARAREVPGVVFTGWQQRDRTPWYYSLADVLVFPTLGDPNGLVVTEALAAGLPVVSQRRGGEHPPPPTARRAGARRPRRRRPSADGLPASARSSAMATCAGRCRPRRPPTCRAWARTATRPTSTASSPACSLLRGAGLRPLPRCAPRTSGGPPWRGDGRPGAVRRCVTRGAGPPARRGRRARTGARPGAAPVGSGGDQVPQGTRHGERLRAAPRPRRRAAT